MIRIHKRIAADADLVWSLLTDTRRWPEWGPSVAAVHHDGDMITASSTGRIQLPVGVWVGFQITAFTQGRCFRWNVGGFPATGHRVRSLTEGASELIFEVPTWAAPYALVCKVACSRIARLAEQ